MAAASKIHSLLYRMLSYFYGQVFLKHTHIHTQIMSDSKLILYLSIALYFDFLLCLPSWEERKSSGVEKAVDLENRILSLNHGFAPWNCISLGKTLNVKSLSSYAGRLDDF